MERSTKTIDCAMTPTWKFCVVVPAHAVAKGCWIVSRSIDDRIGAFVVLVAVQVSVVRLYLPPVLKPVVPPFPPQTIISLPVQTAVCCQRTVGALTVLVAVQLSVAGLYFPPVFDSRLTSSNPPHTIISLPLKFILGPNSPSNFGKEK